MRGRTGSASMHHHGSPRSWAALRIARFALVALCGLGLTAGVVRAAGDESWQVSGRLATEFRGYADQPAFQGQTDGGEASFLLNPEFDRAAGNGRDLFRIVPFLRIDGRDAARTHFDLREAYWQGVWDEWEMLAGVERVFWGVTESRHLVDVINQTDLVERIDGEEKLGQPMVQVAIDRRWGRLEAYALLGFRERTFPGDEGRLRTPLPIDTDAAIYESGSQWNQLDAALRWSHYFGDWDVGAHWFRGIGREPQLIVDLEQQRLIPFYSETQQVGVDVQYTRNAWLWKLETLVREGHGATFAAAVGGFEYTFYQVGRSAADVGLLVELLYDGRDASTPTTIYDDDIFVGSRLALNDAADTQLLGGVIVDRNDGSTSTFIEAERRLGTRYRLELEARWFNSRDDGNLLAVFDDDSHLILRVSRYF